MSYVPESDIHAKCYDLSNFSRASVVQFRASWYIIFPNRKSAWKVITIRMSWELSLFNYERLDELCPRIGLPCEKLWQVKFVESFRCSISSISIYYVPESNIRVKCYDYSNFSRASVVQLRASRWNMFRIGHPNEKLWPFEFPESFRCSISSV